jgi:hypothetical protein
MRLTICGLSDPRSGRTAGAAHDSVLMHTISGPCTPAGQEIASFEILAAAMRGGVKLNSISRLSLVEVASEDQAVISVLGGVLPGAEIRSTAPDYPLTRAKRAAAWRKRAPVLTEIAEFVDTMRLNVILTHVHAEHRRSFSLTLDRCRELARVALYGPPDGAITVSHPFNHS